MNADDFGALIADTARGFDGACACADHRQSIFDAVGMPFDPTPFHVVNGKVHGISTCYVFARHVLDLCGVDLPPWHIGEPIGTMIAWAKRNGCWQTPGDGLAPSRGDVLFVGPRGGTHVCVVDCVTTDAIWTIDGGQVCRRTTDGHDGLGRQMIAARERDWFGDFVVGVQRDAVVGWVVAGLMPLRQSSSSAGA